MIFSEKSQCVNHTLQPNSAAKNDTVFNHRKTIDVYCYNSMHIMLNGIVNMLCKEPSIRIVGQTTSVDVLLDNFNNTDKDQWPDIIIVDANSPPLGGVKTLLQLAPRDTRNIVVFDNDDDLTNALRFFRININNYLQSRIEEDELIAAIKTIAQGETVIHLTEENKTLAAKWINRVLPCMINHNK